MKSIVITSGKGGVGKTTVTAYLGRALCALGLRVALMDADFGLNNLDVVLGLENRVVYDIADVVDNRCRVRQALIATDTRNMFLLPSAHGVCERITSQNLRLVLNGLASTFDYTLVDCPAGIESGFKRAVLACDRALVVTTPHISALRDANKVITLLSSYGKTSSLIVNRARIDLMRDGVTPSVPEISAALKITVDGVIPESDSVYSNMSGTSNKPFELLAKRIHYGTGEIYSTERGNSGVIGAIRRALKRR